MMILSAAGEGIMLALHLISILLLKDDMSDEKSN